MNPVLQRKLWLHDPSSIPSPASAPEAASGAFLPVGANGVTYATPRELLTDGLEYFNSSIECAICHEHDGLKLRIRKCGHIFDAECLVKHLSVWDTCPMCRARLFEHPGCPVDQFVFDPPPALAALYGHPCQASGCGKAFKCDVGLTAHMKLHATTPGHTEVIKYFVCYLCREKKLPSCLLFESKRAFDMHNTVVHTWNCPMCDFRTSKDGRYAGQWEALRFHLHNSHSTTGIACNGCDQTYGHPDAYRAHKTEECAAFKRLLQADRRRSFNDQVLTGFSGAKPRPIKFVAPAKHDVDVVAELRECSAGRKTLVGERWNHVL